MTTDSTPATFKEFVEKKLGSWPKIGDMPPSEFRDWAEAMLFFVIEFRTGITDDQYGFLTIEKQSEAVNKALQDITR